MVQTAMSKPRKGKEKAIPRVSKAASVPNAGRLGEYCRQHPWGCRFLLMVMVPALLLGLAELLARALGGGYATAFFIRNPDSDQLTTNPFFSRQFLPQDEGLHPFLMNLDERKGSGHVRIVILGESAAMGTPDPAFGFGRMLEEMLRRQYPHKTCEVINAAMRGIDSHVIRRIAADCAKIEPDLLMVYAGNNEAIGLHSPRPDTWAFTLNPTLIRLAQVCKSTHLGQWLRITVLAGGKREAQTMEMFRVNRLAPSDPRFDLLDRNFYDNLRAICQTAPAVPKVLATVAVNLKDCPPLGSLHRPGLSAVELARWQEVYERGIIAEQGRQYPQAVEHFKQALVMDDQFAELHYRLARCYEAGSELMLAQKHYALARDGDALPFRAGSRINQQIRRLADVLATEGVVLCDVEKAFKESEWSDHGVPGAKLFYEHVHPTFDGTWLLARSVYPQVTQTLAKVLGPPLTAELPSRDDCARALAFTKFDEFNAVSSMVLLTGRAPFLDQVDHAARQAAAERKMQAMQTLSQAEVDVAMAIYRGALRQRPTDWCLQYNYALLHAQLQRPGDAIGNLEWLVENYPEHGAFHVALGNALLECGRRAEAVDCFKRGIEHAPRNTQLRERLAKLQ